MPCLLDSFSRIRAFEYTIYDYEYLKKKIYNLFSLSTQTTTRGHLAKSSHPHHETRNELCPLMTQVSAQSGKGFAPPSPETSDNFEIDVWRMICES